MQPPSHPSENQDDGTTSLVHDASQRPSYHQMAL